MEDRKDRKEFKLFNSNSRHRILINPMMTYCTYDASFFGILPLLSLLCSVLLVTVTSVECDRVAVSTVFGGQLRTVTYMA